jgi:hypothetical protein
MPHEKYDLVSAALLVVTVCGVALTDMLLYSVGGEHATISAYLRRVLTIHPAITSAVSVAIGALWAHIFLCK